MEGEESKWRIISNADCVICYMKLQPKYLYPVMVFFLKIPCIDI
jgi:hypothetical protein